MFFPFLVVVLLFTGCQLNSKPMSDILDTTAASTLKPYLLQHRLIKNKSPLFGIKSYLLHYTIKRKNGDIIDASATITIPIAKGCDKESLTKLEEIKRVGFATVLNNHPTIFAKADAPSLLVNKKKPSKSAILLSAINGFITVTPDYIGFGASSNLPHPYFIKETSQESTLALIRAYQNFCTTHNITIDLKRGLYMVGYSEGGYSTLASLEALNKSGYSLPITIAGAAPYILEDFAKKAIEQDRALIFIAYTIYSYAKNYSDIDLTTIINHKYLQKFLSLFDSSLTKKEIEEQLPKKLIGEDGLLQESFIANFEESTLFKHLQENSLKDIKISDRVKLFHCRHDTLIPYSSSQSMLNRLLSQGVNVSLHNVEKYVNYQKTDHSECGIYSYAIAAKIFAQLRLVLQGY